MMNIVREHINESKNKKMDISSGLVILCDNKILLAHPTNAPWKGSYSIPKGHAENDENLLEAAIRETKEEVGIEIDKSAVSKEKGVVEYTDKSGKTYKIVHYYVVYLSEEPEIKKSQLEREEVDHAKFFDLEEARDVIFWRFRPLLKYVTK